MRLPSTLLVLASLLIPTATLGGSTLSITPTESLSAVRDKLRADANITEVILAEGVYFGGLSVEGPKGTDFAQHPLLIRAADEAQVMFDGARPVKKSRPHEELPGVFWIDYTSDGGEYPKFWEHRGESGGAEATGDVRLRLQQLRHRASRAATWDAIRQRVAARGRGLPERRLQGDRQLHGVPGRDEALRQSGPVAGVLRLGPAHGVC